MATCLLSPWSLPWCFTHQLLQSMAFASLCSPEVLHQGSLKYLGRQRKKEGEDQTTGRG